MVSMLGVSRTVSEENELHASIEQKKDIVPDLGSAWPVPKTTAPGECVQLRGCMDFCCPG